MFPTLRKLVLVVLGIPFVILGTRLLLDAGGSLLTWNMTDSWTPHSGRVTSVEHYSGDDQALGNQTVVHYSYEYGGVRHEGTYSCVGDECPAPDLRQSMEAAREAERDVAVLVDPDQPARSVLYRNLYMPLFLLRAGAGLFCFLTGSVSVIFGVYLLSGAGARKGGK
jgi:hypothetical protein